MAVFEEIGIASYTAVLVNLLPGATYAWTVNNDVHAPVAIPRPPNNPMTVQIQFETTQPGSDSVSINVVGGGNDPIEEVILVPLGQRQRRVA